MPFVIMTLLLMAKQKTEIKVLETSILLIRYFINAIILIMREWIILVSSHFDTFILSYRQFEFVQQHEYLMKAVNLFPEKMTQNIL